jgi:predicted PurR-regulated permease PerM
LLKDLKIPYLRLIPILIIAFVLYKLIDNFGMFIQGIKFFLSIISYITWAFCIAYLLNPIMVFIEKKLKVGRAISMLAVYILFAGFVTFFAVVIAPVIVKNMWELIENIPRYVVTTREWLNTLTIDSEWIDKEEILGLVQQNASYFVERSKDLLELSLTEIIKNMISFTSALVKFLIGSAISIYLLKDKETLINSLKRLSYAVLKKSHADVLMDVAGKANRMISRFLLGKAIDSLIIGIICFIGLSILNVRYTLLISLIVGVTNMIPYFGPIFGAVPAVLLTLFYDPLKAIWVLLFLFVLQQFDGWILGPRILGISVGLKPFWIIVGILVGGGLFGVIGMLLGVPCAAVIRIFLSEYINRRLSEKEIAL